MSKMYQNKKNYVVAGEVGKTYAFCTCGHSDTPPHCDGAHKKNPSHGKPHVHKCEQIGDMFLCGCGGSKNKPWCDGTHKRCPEHEAYMTRS